MSQCFVKSQDVGVHVSLLYWGMESIQRRLIFRTSLKTWEAMKTERSSKNSSFLQQLMEIEAFPYISSSIHLFVTVSFCCYSSHPWWMSSLSLNDLGSTSAAINGFLPNRVQFCPSPVYPVLQLQSYDPLVLLQMAWELQRSVFGEHSSTSENEQRTTYFSRNILNVDRHSFLPLCALKIFSLNFNFS